MSEPDHLLGLIQSMTPAFIVMSIVVMLNVTTQTVLRRIDYAEDRTRDIRFTLEEARIQVGKLYCLQLVREAEERRAAERRDTLRRALYRGGPRYKRGRIGKTFRGSGRSAA